METLILVHTNLKNDYLIKANGNKHKFRLLDVRLNGDTAYLAKGAKAVFIFVNDDASAPVLEKLKEAGVQFSVLRSAGFNHVNIEKAKELGIRVARVPAYSPYAVAEHTVALILALNRKLIRANSRVHDSNFSLDGLTGFDMHGKTAGIISTGKVGEVIARILYGFDCKIIVSDQVENEMLKAGGWWDSIHRATNAAGEYFNIYHSGGMMWSQMVLTATLNADQRKIKAVSARVMGRIELLYFKNEGDYVRKGDKLYDLYSEELNSAKQEYVLALDKENNLENSLIDFKALTKSAKNKLVLWGLSAAQIREIAVKKLATPITTFYSPVSGTITNIAVGEGEYTMEGGTILKLTDLTTLWAEAQVYAYQLAQVEKNSVASVQFPDLPGKHTDGRIEFANPEINPQTRINLLRVSISNSENLLKPGMPAFVTLKGKQLDAITLPSDAVLRAEKGVSVWVQTSNRSFTSRMIKLVMEDGNQVQIKSGLQSGDIVVISGAYLLNSESLFKNGANPMEGMKM